MHMCAVASSWFASEPLVLRERISRSICYLRTFFFRLIISGLMFFFKMMYQDRESKKHFIPDVQLLLTDQDSSKILSMLKSENLSNLVDSDGTTLLHLSAKCHNKFLVDYLISENIDVNATDSFGETPLMSAVQNHTHVEVWKALLDAGADLWKMKTNSGQSALTIFIRKYRSHLTFSVLLDEIEKRCVNSDEVGNVLLSAGFQLYHLDIFKKSEITKLMLERGCPVNLKNFEGVDNHTALHVAAKINDLENVKILLQFGADKHVENFDHYPPIVTAFCYNTNPNKELIKLLLPDDKDWIKKGDIMNTIFLTCSKESLEFLVQQCNVDLNVRDAKGQSGLYHLMANEDLRIWEVLKNVKLDINAIDKQGKSVLHQAVAQKNVEAVQFLLDAGANVNALDGEGQPPLFYIPWSSPFLTKRSQDCIELLMEHGADAQLVDQNGGTIISHLISHRDYYLFDSIFPHLALIEACGSTLNPIILNEIEASSVTERIFKKCQQELDEMKRKTISGMVTYFKFLTEEDEKIGKYVRNEEVVKELSKCENTSYLYQLLIERFEKAMEISRWRRTASQLIIECVEPLDGHCLIIENILDFLDITDFKLIAGID